MENRLLMGLRNNAMGVGASIMSPAKKMGTENRLWRLTLGFSVTTITAYIILALWMLTYLEISTLNNSGETTVRISSNHVRRTMHPSFVSRYPSTKNGEIMKEGNFTRQYHTNNHFIPGSIDGELSRESEELLDRATRHVFAPLTTMDRESYTIRINTWQRNEQLITSINHHAKCEGVAQIQVIWCNTEEEPPREVIFHPSQKVMIEYHKINSLNERFNVLLEPPTKGILSIDDDVLRSCEALDNAFFKWTKAYGQIVGFDARLHGINAIRNENKSGWDYLGNFDTFNADSYSMVLLRAAFLHRDFLDLYMNNLPNNIRRFVDENFNCEDIAMSLLVSRITNKPPLLADSWSIDSMVKLHSAMGISTGDADHKQKRHYCLTQFAKELGLFTGQPNELKSYKLKHHRIHLRGAELRHLKNKEVVIPREQRLLEITKHFTSSVKSAWRWNLQTSFEAMEAGLVPGTVPFEKRLGRNRTKEVLAKEEEFLAIGLAFNNLTIAQKKLYNNIKHSLQERAWFQKECALLNDNANSFLINTYCDGLINLK